VGQFYTGSGFRLVVVNDKDAGTLNNTSRFRNVRVYEAQPPPSGVIDWNATPTVPYPNQDGSGLVEIEDGGNTLFLTGNRWRQTNDTFTITSDTMLEFEFWSDSQGEVHGIGFDEDGNIGNGQRIFRLYGTQNWTGDINWTPAYPGNGEFVTYTIPVGEYYTGSGFWLVVVNDKDAGTLNNTSRFRNVRVYEK